MKKVLSVLMALAIMLSCVSISTFADNGYSVAVTDVDGKYAVGDIIKITVSLDGFPEAKTLGVLLDYDEEVLEYLGDGNSKWLVTGLLPTFDPSQGTGGLASQEKIDVNTDVCEIAFKVLKTTDTEVKVAMTVKDGKTVYIDQTYEDYIVTSKITFAKVECTTHSWGEGVVTEPATCIGAGVMTYTCSACGATKTDEIPATNVHNWENKVLEDRQKSPADCENDAVYYKTCSSCDTKDDAQTFEAENTALGHNYGEWEPKEGDDENHYKYCTNEGCTESESEAHGWQESSRTEATCVNDGTINYSCSACGGTKTESISATGAHDYGDEWSQEEDHHYKECSVCENRTTEEHTWNEVTTAPSCEQPGETTFTCSVCDYSYTEPLSATGHAWGEWTSAGESEHRRDCEECDVYETDDHAWQETDKTDAACNTPGEIISECSACGETKTDPIPATGEHKWINDEAEKELASDATCTSAATYYKVCSDCGTHSDTETFEVGEPLGHEWAYSEKDSTQHNKYCAREGCDETQPEDHKLESKVTKEPSCHAKGETTYTCSDCGYSYTEDIPTTEHTWGEWTSNGESEHKRDCTNEGCSESESKSHTWSEIVDEDYLVTDADCDSNAVYRKSCSVCGAVHSTETFEDENTALGHTWSEIVHEDRLVAAADCDNNAVYKKSCSVCGEAHATETFEVGEPLGHDWSDWTSVDEFDNGAVTTQPSCFEAGEKTFTCGDCAHTKTEPINATGNHVLGEWVDSLDGLTHTRTCVTEGCPEHETHNYSLVLAYNNAGHWRVCESGCTRVYGYELHYYSGDVCINCGYTKPANEIVSGYIYVNEDYHMMILTNGVIVNNHVLDVNDICIYCLGHVPSLEDDAIVDIEEPIEPSTEEEETDIVPETEEPEENPETGVAFGTLALAIASMAIALCKKH